MTSEEKGELDALCKRVIEEEDQTKFMELVLQLNTFLESKDCSSGHPSDSEAQSN